MTPEVARNRPRAIVAAVQLASVSDAELDASLTELRQLAKTLGFEVVGRFTSEPASARSCAISC
jgi:GTP-binding protein HflX